MSKKLVVNRIGAATHKDHSLPPFWTPFSLFVTKKSDGEDQLLGTGYHQGRETLNLPCRSVRKLLPRMRR
jgi:hypothetical protein